MKISRNDPFDLKLCLRGLGNLITAMHSDIYNYMFYLTFKGTLKAYYQDFNDPWEHAIEELAFFTRVDDPFVKSCTAAQNKLITFKLDIILRFGLNEQEDVADEDIITQQKRYQPYFLISKNSKSCKKLKNYYVRTLSESIYSLYLYACAITANSYKIPLVLKRQLDHVDEPLRLLNHDDSTVELLVQLMMGLQKDLEIFLGLSAITSKVKRDLYYEGTLK